MAGDSANQMLNPAKNVEYCSSLISLPFFIEHFFFYHHDQLIHHTKKEKKRIFSKTEIGRGDLQETTGLIGEAAILKQNYYNIKDL